MTNDATKLLKAAEDYSKYALEHLTFPVAEPARLVAVEAFKVHYMFPVVSPEAKSILGQLSFLVKGLNANLAADQTELTEEHRRLKEQATTGGEALFVAWREQLRKQGVFDQLTPIQMEVLESQYLTVKFPS